MKKNQILEVLCVFSSFLQISEIENLFFFREGHELYIYVMDTWGSRS